MYVTRFVGVMVALSLLATSCVKRHRHPRSNAPPATPAAVAFEDPNKPQAPLVEKWLVPEAVKADSPFASEACTAQTQQLLAKLTLAEKIGQMVQVERRQVPNIDDIRKLALGSLLSGGGSTPPKNEPQAWLDMSNSYAAVARASRLGIPLIYGIDAVHGHNNVQGAVIFPHNIGLGCTRDPELVEKIARATAEEVSATGIDWTFAPVVAAARDERWGRTYEAFGETAELAESLGPAAIRGYQGKRLGEGKPSVLACAKHFVADGGTWSGKDRGDSILDAKSMLDVHLRQYQAAIAAGVGSIMLSYSSVNGTKMHEHRALVTDVLKQQMGFAGFVISDFGAIELLPGKYPEQLQSAVNAGIDMIMAPRRFPDALTTLASLVPNQVPMARIDDAVSRILTTKCELGLFKANRPRPPISIVGSSEHRVLAREAVARSLVVLKNERDILPIDPNTPKIHMAGRAADDIGYQCGGWTFQWQGSVGPITTGTTIRRGIESSVARGATVSYSRDASGAKGANVVIVVVGERPYAEYTGDRRSPALDDEDERTILAAKASGAKVVLIVISGRPLLLGNLVDSVDALVAAWLPGSEGAGVADVLLGRVKPTGKLSRTWPKSLDQIPLNLGEPNYAPLYPYGAGLTYP
jgi:beta-glucosidase